MCPQGTARTFDQVLGILRTLCAHYCDSVAASEILRGPSPVGKGRLGSPTSTVSPLTEPSATDSARYACVGAVCVTVQSIMGGGTSASPPSAGMGSLKAANRAPIEMAISQNTPHTVAAITGDGARGGGVPRSQESPPVIPRPFWEGNYGSSSC